MPRTLIIGTMAAISACVVPLAAAAAQAPDSDAAARTRPAITVIAPRARQTGRTYTGIPIETLSAQSVVYFDDLNLRTEDGQKELKDRVATAARESCKWLDEVYPLTKPIGPDDCAMDAAKRAQDQVDAAIKDASL